MGVVLEELEKSALDPFKCQILCEKQCIGILTRRKYSDNASLPNNCS